MEWSPNAVKLLRDIFPNELDDFITCKSIAANAKIFRMKLKILLSFNTKNDGYQEKAEINKFVPVACKRANPVKRTIVLIHRLPSMFKYFCLVIP